MKLVNIKRGLTLDEVSLIPSDLSYVKSRADVNPKTTIFNQEVLPIISSNMTSVYSPQLSQEVLKHGGISIVPRFYSIEENVKLFKDGIYTDEYNNGRNFADLKPWVSVGIGEEELERAIMLVNAGAEVIVIDVAMGNSIVAVKQYNKLRETFGNTIKIIVSDFSTREQLEAFNNLLIIQSSSNILPDGFTIGQGSGSPCITRQVTGIGIPTATMIDNCVSYTKETKQLLILNGGIKSQQDLCKAIALGCDAVIIGRLFAACEESSAITTLYSAGPNKCTKKYSGSASIESYITQDKVSSYRVAEGETFEIPVSGTVKQLMQQLEAGLRSSMSYLNAHTIQEYKVNGQFIEISSSGARESGSYGKHE